MRLPNRGNKRPMLKAAQQRNPWPWPVPERPFGRRCGTAIYNKPCPPGQVCNGGYCVFPVPATEVVAYGSAPMWSAPQFRYGYSAYRGR